MCCYILKTSWLVPLSFQRPLPIRSKETEERILYFDSEIYMHAIYGQVTIPAKLHVSINSEILGLGIYPEEESMTEDKYLVTRMLILALLIKMKN